MLKVIIADDEKKICQLLCNIVNWRELGFNVVSVEYDGVSLLASIKKNRPDIVVTDIRMPGMTGIELLHEVRKEGLNTDFIIISGYRDFDYAQSAIRNGAADYLLKPISKETLLKSLQRIKERRITALEKEKNSKKIRNKLDNIIVKAQNTLVSEIISGKIKKKTIKELNTEYDCGFSGSQLFFATVKYDLSKNLKFKAGEVVGDKIRTIISENMESQGIRDFTEVGDNFIYVLINANSQETVQNALYHLLYIIKEFCAKWEEGHITIGLSPVINENLYNAFVNSRIAALNHLLLGPDRVILRDETETIGKAFVFNNDDINSITDAITGIAKDKLNDACVRLIDTITDYGVKENRGDIIFENIDEIEKRIIDFCDLTYNDSSITNVLVKWSSRVLNCSDVNALKKLFDQQNEELIEAVQEYKNQIDKKPIRQFKYIIDKRFMEQISLEDVANELHLTTTYVSKLIRKELGVTYTQYITNIRVDKAKKLLVETNESATEIAYSVGYNDVKYFLRVFKQEVGLTTKDYKKLYGN